MAGSPSQTLRRTPLYDRHVAAGARLVPFAGWEMPVQYDGVRQEHLRVRSAAGIFDVSHMGQIQTSGPQAVDLLQRLLSNDIARIGPGGAQYAVMCREDGGVLDDMITYRLEDGFLTVTNAANHPVDLAWFRQHARDLDVEVIDRSDELAMLAVQGPQAREIVQAAADHPLPARMTAARLFVGGTQMLVCGTGYTGEDGVELLLDAGRAPEVWDALVRRGAAPAGLGARDTLRLEACLPLYGNELSLQRGPLEARLGWCCREDTGFIGSDAVRAARADGTAQRLVAFAIEGQGIARQGNVVLGGGEVTSGTMSPTLGEAVGMAYVPTERARAGGRLEIDVRGRTREAVIRDMPLVAKHSAPPA